MFQNVLALISELVAVLPRVFLVPTSRVWWPSLLIAGVMSAGVYFWTKPRREGSVGLVRYLLPVDVLFHPSALMDCKLWAGNLVFRLIVTPAFVAAAKSSRWCCQHSQQRLGVHRPHHQQPLGAQLRACHLAVAAAQQQGQHSGQRTVVSRRVSSLSIAPRRMYLTTRSRRKWLSKASLSNHPEARRTP